MHDLTAGSETYLELGADVDAAALAQWDPLNVTDPYDIKIHFDGKNHKIKNLKSANCNYAGFFGVLNGECKNVTFESCTVSQNKNSACGILGGYAGTNGGLSATVSNVTAASSCSVSSTGTQPCGGLVGIACNATFSSCSVAATVTSGNSSGTTTDHGCGGLVGKINKTSTFSNCTFSGTCSGKRLVGGIAGWTSCSNCSFTSCTNIGTVTASESGEAKGQRCGGICGHIQDGTTVTKCVNTGSVTAVQQAGGIVGYIETNNSTIVVSRCCSGGQVRTSGSNWAGGIAGYMVSGKISDCWTSGSVTAQQQGAAGIVGEIKSGYIDATNSNLKAEVLNCWSKATISCQRVAGGIAGRCAHDGWNAKATDAQKTSNITISKCIAWNPSIIATEQGDVNGKGSSGAVVAYTYIKSTLSDCYRLATMAFSGPYAECNPVDQPNVSDSSPLTVGVQDTYCYPWHGKASGSGATISSLAITLGWDSTIWNLSGSEPTLK